MNIDTANRDNPIEGKIVMSNLCSEVMQVQTPSIINDLQEYEKLGTDVSCNLGSTNVVNLMRSTNFGKSITTMVRALTFVSDSSKINVVPSIRHGNDLSHSIGLGAMGLHSYLALHHLYYGEPDSVEFTSVYFMLLNYWTLVASNQLAKERGITFDNFENSKYADGSYFDKYTSKDWGPRSERVKSLFQNIDIPTPNDWQQLQAAVQEFGLYHQNRMAVAPNGSTAYIGDATASLAPIVSRIEERQEAKIGTIFLPCALPFE